MQTLRKLSSVFLAALFLCLFLAATPADAQQKPGVPVQVTVPDTALEVTGWAAPGALVTIRNEGITIAAVTADNSGYFARLFTAQTPGLKSISTQFSDRESVESVRSIRNVSLQPQKLNSFQFLLSPTVSIRSQTTVVQGGIAQIGGYSAADSIVQLSLSDGSKYTATTDLNGFYRFFIPSEGLAVGDYSATVIASSSQYSGNSVRSDKVNFEIVSTPIVADNGSRPDIIVNVNQLPPPFVLSPVDGAVIEGDSTTLSGESVPNAQIVFYENGVRAGSVFADENGFWSIEYTATSSPVVLSFEACIDGFCSVLSNSITLIFTFPKSLILEPVCEVVFKLEQYKFSNQSVDTATELNVLLTNGDGVILVDWGDGTNQQKFDHSAETPSAIRHFYKSAGRYNGKITFTQGDCSFDRYFSVDTITSNRISNNFWLLIVVIVLLTPVSYIANERGRKYKP